MIRACAKRNCTVTLLNWVLKYQIANSMRLIYAQVMSATWKERRRKKKETFLRNLRRKNENRDFILNNEIQVAINVNRPSPRAL